MSKIRPKIEGYMLDIEYTAWLPGIFQEYEDKFGDAESVNVEIVEIPYMLIGKTQAKTPSISDDGKTVNVYFSYQAYYDKNGKETGKPSSYDNFNSLKQTMNSAVKEYHDKILSK